MSLGWWIRVWVGWWRWWGCWNSGKVTPEPLLTQFNQRKDLREFCRTPLGRGQNSPADRNYELKIEADGCETYRGELSTVDVVVGTPVAGIAAVVGGGAGESGKTPTRHRDGDGMGRVDAEERPPLIPLDRPVAAGETPST